MTRHKVPKKTTHGYHRKATKGFERYVTGGPGTRSSWFIRGAKPKMKVSL
jgi:hypothetical protein